MFLSITQYIHTFYDRDLKSEMKRKKRSRAARVEWMMTTIITRSHEEHA